MKNNLYTNSFLLLVSALCIASCGSNKEDKPAAKASQDSVEVETHSPVTELTTKQLQAVGMELSVIEKKNLNAVIKASGQLEVPPQNKAEVNVLTGGIIRKINVLEGQAVKKGQVLAILENPEFIKLEQEYLVAKNTFTYTREELTRQDELNTANAGTGKNLQHIQSAYNAEKAKLLTMEKQLQQLGIDPGAVASGNIISQVAVVAPINGTIGHIGINTGTYVQIAKPLMDIIDNSQIHCDLVVYEKDLFKVKVGQKVNFMLTNQNNQAIQGEIYGVNKSFEDDSKGIIVHAVIKNAMRYHLIPGMYVTALIDVGNVQTDAVPVDAVVHSEGKDYIFVMTDEHGMQPQDTAVRKYATAERLFFKKTEVTTGVTELGYIQITLLEELPAQAMILTKGAFYLLSKEKASGHDED